MPSRTTDRGEVERTQVPGVGTRADFVTAHGDRVGVLLTAAGERQLLVFDRADPDACTVVVRLSTGDVQRLAELLGGG